MAKKRSRTVNSIINLITSLGGRMLVTVLGFVTRTVFINTLGSAYLGINGLFSDILSMLSLTELGIESAMNFKLYKPLAQHDEKRVRILMKFYRSAYLVVGAAVLGLGLLLIPFLPKLIRDYDSLSNLGINAVLIYLLFLLKSVSSYWFFAYRSAIIKADQRQYVLTISMYFVTLLTHGTEILVLIFWKNFVAYTACGILFAIIQNAVNAIIANHDYRYAFQKEEESMSREELRDLFKDLGALFVYKTNGVVLKATDNLVLSSFIGLTVVGLYSNYLLFYTTIRSFLDRFYTSILASAGNLFAVGTLDQKYRFFEVMNYLSALLYGTAFVGVAVVADEMIQVWIGSKYIIPQPFALLIGIEIIFVGLKRNLGQIRSISGAFRQMWFRPVLGIIINVGVSILLVGKLGIYGVIIGTITADIAANFAIDPLIIHRVIFENYRPVSEYYLRNAQYALVLVLTGLADHVLCQTVLVGFGWLSVIVHVCICGVSVPAVFLLVFRKRHETQYLIDKVQHLLHRKA